MTNGRQQEEEEEEDDDDDDDSDNDSDNYNENSIILSQQTTIIKQPNFLQFIPFIIWLLVIFILLTLPQKDFKTLDMKLPFQDKIVHMGLFGGVVFFFGLAYRKIPFALSKGRLLIMVLIATFYGVAMEFVQKYYTGHTRSFSYDDMMADALGAVIGYFLIRYIIIKYNTKLLK